MLKKFSDGWGKGKSEKSIVAYFSYRNCFLTIHREWDNKLDELADKNKKFTYLFWRWCPWFLVISFWLVWSILVCLKVRSERFVKDQSPIYTRGMETKKEFRVLVLV